MHFQHNLHLDARLYTNNNNKKIKDTAALRLDAQMLYE